MKKIILLLILSLFAQGCVGIMTLRTKSVTFLNPKIWDYADHLGVEWQDIENKASAKTYNSVWLDSHWGKPARIKSPSPQGNIETWTYDFGRRWNGIVPMIGIPIPLVIPVGREQVEFTFKDDQVVNARLVYEQEYEAVAGWYLHGPCGPTLGLTRRSIP